MASLGITAEQMGGGAGTKRSASDSGGGQGEVVVELVQGRSTVSRAQFSYPLKLMLPHVPQVRIRRPSTSGGQAAQVVPPRGVGAALVYVVTYGGGLLAGDCITLRCTVADSAVAVLTTQSSTKVFKCAHASAPASSQSLLASVGAGALLAVLPDPVTCFAQSRFRQQQDFCLAAGASLVLVDWLTCGRKALGEAWALDSYRSATRVFQGETLVVREQVALSSKGPLATGPMGAPLSAQLDGVHCMGFLVLLGPQTVQVQKELTEEVRRQAAMQLTWSSRTASSITAPARVWHASGGGPGRAETQGTQEGAHRVWISCSAVGPGQLDQAGMLLRFSAPSTEDAYRFLKKSLASLSAVLTVEPYSSLGSQ